MNVLVVDDDALFRRTARRALRGFSVDEAEDGPTALAAASRQQYDAAVIDVCLRGHTDRSGVALAATLRGSAGVAAILLTSGIVTTELQRLAESVGANGWIAKGDATRPSLRATLEAVIAAGALRTCLPTKVADLVNDVRDATIREDRAKGERAYRLALLAREAVGASGASQVVQLAASAVGVSTELLRQYAFIASRWPDDELREILTNSTGITISLLKELSPLPLAERKRWLARLRTSAARVRDVREELRRRE